MPESLFVETEAEASLRRIAEWARHRVECRARLAKAKAAYKEAKEAYDEACIDEQQAVDTETAELPLFPRPREQPGSGLPEPEAGPLAPSVPASDPDPDRTTFLSSLDGMPHAATVVLGSFGYMTVSDLLGFLNSGGMLNEIEGIDPAAERKILAALSRHRPGWEDADRQGNSSPAA
jgi:hypothetical protein